MDTFGRIGFDVERSHVSGYVKFIHPDLEIEFLAPERGRGTDKPVRIVPWGVNAQALRYLNLLMDGPVNINYHGYNLNLPHPARFRLHKLILSQIRENADKAKKDAQSGIAVLNALISIRHSKDILDAYQSLPKKWKDKAAKCLKSNNELMLVKLFNIK